MDELTFAFMPANRGSEAEAILLARSLRKFGGRYAQAHIWVLVPEQAPLSDKAQGDLAALNVIPLPFEAPPAALEFPYAVKVYAAAAAELHLKGKTSLLAWLISLFDGGIVKMGLSFNRVLIVRAKTGTYQP